MPAPKKRDPRRSVRQAGWVILEGGFAARPCEVFDLSTTGAKIVVDDPSALTSKIKLGFTRDGRGGRACEVVWRKGKSIGLRFVG